jgi:hypothetical protein
VLTSSFLIARAQIRHTFVVHDHLGRFQYIEDTHALRIRSEYNRLRQQLHVPDSGLMAMAYVSAARRPDRLGAGHCSALHWESCLTQKTKKCQGRGYLQQRCPLCNRLVSFRCTHFPTTRHSRTCSSCYPENTLSTTSKSHQTKSITRGDGSLPAVAAETNAFLI